MNPTVRRQTRVITPFFRQQTLIWLLQVAVIDQQQHAAIRFRSNETPSRLLHFVHARET